MGRPKGGHNKPMSPEHHEKITIINRKKAADPEFRKKLSVALKGKTRTEEQKSKLRKPKTEKSCPTCQKKFFVAPCHLDQKYCSKNCANISKKGTSPSEETRKKFSIAQKRLWSTDEHRSMMKEAMKDVIMSDKTKQKIGDSNRKKAKDPKFLETLSKALKGKKKSDAFRESIRGVGNHQWKGGLRPLAKAIRDSIKYAEWRLSVYKRDNFCDWFSGLPGHGNLTAHHRDPFNNILRSNNIKTFDEAMACEALWNVNNGVTMFKISHEAYHQMWGNDTHPNGKRTKDPN